MGVGCRADRLGGHELYEARAHGTRAGNRGSVALDMAAAGAAVCRGPDGLLDAPQQKELLDGRVVSHVGER
jgi:hypothetical protein